MKRNMKTDYEVKNMVDAIECGKCEVIYFWSQQCTIFLNGGTLGNIIAQGVLALESLNADMLVQQIVDYV